MKPKTQIIVLILMITAAAAYFSFRRQICPGLKWSYFDSPDAPGSGKKMNPGTLARLCTARAKYGSNFIINSGYRTTPQNIKVGGVPGSSHLKGHAADIATTPANQQKIIEALKFAGFKRFGIYTNYIHVDDDPSKPTPAQWN